MWCFGEAPMLHRPLHTRRYIVPIRPAQLRPSRWLHRDLNLLALGFSVAVASVCGGRSNAIMGPWHIHYSPYECDFATHMNVTFRRIGQTVLRNMFRNKTGRIVAWGLQDVAAGGSNRVVVDSAAGRSAFL